MSLAELVCVVAIIGLLGAMAATRYGSSTVADVGADGFARRLALDCLQARRAAISTGNNQNYLLRFTLVGGKATQYAMFRRQGANVTQVDDTRVVPKGVDVTTGGTVDMEFNFGGEALGSYTITCAAPDRTRTVVVPQITGKAFVE
jgi:type II secretory pathway pseudopilin PulG